MHAVSNDPPMPVIIRRDFSAKTRHQLDIPCLPSAYSPKTTTPILS